jgi:hypothetical protein
MRLLWFMGSSRPAVVAVVRMWRPLCHICRGMAVLLRHLDILTVCTVEAERLRSHSPLEWAAVQAADTWAPLTSRLPLPLAADQQASQL